ncbi:GntR family transcriptional regulator [Bradyrhizobium sp. CCBAU 45389]|uniref:GntR family transcriptional regulator n=1 Tax=Bradyrhizobium sp. CCBAU 45389 TaxID=858429 RepID=UPI00230554E1|nr:GntR family transcriptional regulator [Bradyrhizobium sp. CCBAU 45389]MDA9402145.1 GntR family transcriptional regulator [Bradyrhizobium sp. CCBAU 45389]
MTSALQISDRLLDAILAKKLEPGSRLGEQQLAELFDCSRTIVREALVRLETRGLVSVSARRGWYLLEPTERQAREAFEARLVIETGLLRGARPLGAAELRLLRDHLRRQSKAIKGTDVGLRSFILGDFHVCLARCLGNELLAQTLRDLTVRTALIATHHQTQSEARRSFEEHVGIVAALEAEDMPLAERRMGVHLRTWKEKLRLASGSDPLATLRQALSPIATVEQSLHTRSSKETRSIRRPARPRPVSQEKS